jgi:hypothetical protein
VGLAGQVEATQGDLGALDADLRRLEDCVNSIVDIVEAFGQFLFC